MQDFNIFNPSNDLEINQKTSSIAIIGLDFAGKTTISNTLLQKNSRIPNEPTTHPNIGKATLGNIDCTIFDLSGYNYARKQWIEYCSTAKAIVFVVDSSDHSRFEEAKFELDAILNVLELQSLPILVLGNKSDKIGAVCEEELRQVLGLPSSHEYGQEDRKDSSEAARPLELFMCNAVCNVGIQTGFKWLQDFIS